MSFTKDAFALFGADGRSLCSGVWLSRANAETAAAALGGFVEVRPSVVNDMVDPLTVATGAAAGSPGHFTPRGAGVVADLASLVGVVADPVSAWTTGQSVALGDESAAHWSGTAWVAGVVGA